MSKKILAALFCIMILFCVSASAADFKEGDAAYVVKYSLPVTEKPTALDCRVERDNKNQLIKVYTPLSAYADPNEPVG